MRLLLSSWYVKFSEVIGKKTQNFSERQESVKIVLYSAFGSLDQRLRVDSLDCIIQLNCFHP